MSTTGGKDRESGDQFDGPTAAFRRLLKDVSGDDRARVDALVVLSQRTVFVATWPTDPESGIRTLTSSTGDTAMPIFSSADMLKEAAQRYGWVNPDGSLSSRELGAREALRRAVARGVQFVVIDIGAEHSVEFSRAEIEPLISVAAQKEPTGPFAVSNKVSSALMDAVRKTSRPPGPSDEAMAQVSITAGSLAPARLPRPSTPFPAERYASGTDRRSSSINMPAQSGRRRAVTPDPARLAAALLDPQDMTFEAPRPMPSDDTLNAIADTLRRFPEVEWAAATNGIRNGAGQPTIVLRVDPSYRTRVTDVNRYVRLAAEDAGVPMAVVLLDDPAQMKSARSVGEVFFPWKNKAKIS